MSFTLQDHSMRDRTGCKGPAAETWLASQGVSVPSGINRYETNAAGVLVARLATSEFLIEAVAGESAELVKRLRQVLERSEMPRGVYPVLRQDCMLEIFGAKCQELFLQTCIVDLEPVALASRADDGPVIMTSMIGVGVVIVCRRQFIGPRFLVWSDPSYGAYFRAQLSIIAADSGGESFPAPSFRARGHFT